VSVGLGLLAARLSAVAPSGGLRLSESGRLQGGSNLTVSWTLDPSVDPEADEMELILSLDGGVSYPIRLTGRISPLTRSVAWRVPALPTERGRIAIRAGRGEEVEDEELLDSSEPFAIDAPTGGVAEDLFPVNNEWRTREAIEGAPVRPLVRRLEAGSSPSNFEPLDLHAAELETGPAEIALPNPSRAPVPASDPKLAPEVRVCESVFLASLPLRL
jgi:hypothetical protein